MYANPPLLVLILVSALLGGCSLTPYQDHFSCQASDEYGRCTDVEGAYHEALTGEPQGPSIRKGEEKGEGVPERGTPPAKTTNGAYASYRENVYRELSGMLEAPVTPMIKRPHVVRTLILPYPTRSQGHALYMARYVYFITDEPTWVLGEHTHQPLSEAVLINPLVETR